jgi:hypothetical protein
VNVNNLVAAGADRGICHIERAWDHDNMHVEVPAVQHGTGLLSDRGRRQYVL